MAHKIVDIENNSLVEEKSAIELINERRGLIIFIYSLLVIFFFFASFLPFSDERYSGFNILGIVAFAYYGGYISVAFLVISDFLIYKYRFRLSITFGISGIITLGVFLSICTYVFSQPNFQGSTPDVGYYTIIIFFILFIVMNLAIYQLLTKENETSSSLIKKTILDLSTKFSRLEIQEIAERCKANQDFISTVVKGMIKRGEIHAEYFANTRVVVFDQQANTREIDRLITQYKQWEDERLGKKEEGSGNSDDIQKEVVLLKVNLSLKKTGGIYHFLTQFINQVKIFNFISLILSVVLLVVPLFYFCGYIGTELVCGWISTGYPFIFYGGWLGILCKIISNYMLVNYNKSFFHSLIFSIMGTCILIGGFIILHLLPIPGFEQVEILSAYYLEIFILVSYVFIDFLLIFVNFIKNVNRKAFNEDIVRELGVTFERLKIREILAMYDKLDQRTILKVVKPMIRNEKIDGEYFKNTSTIAFNIQANIAMQEAIEKYEEQKTLNDVKKPSIEKEGHKHVKQKGTWISRNKNKLVFIYISSAILYFVLLAIFIPPSDIIDFSIQYVMILFIVSIGGIISYLFIGIIILFVVMISWEKFRFFKIIGITTCVISIWVNSIFGFIMFPFQSSLPPTYLLYFIFNPHMIITILIYIILRKNITIAGEEDIALVKRTVLDLGTKYNRLEILEISNHCHDNVFLITRVVKDMIKNQEIHAEYFASSKSVVFNQQANLDEIDMLMAKYEEWEGSKVGKKILDHV